MEQISIFDCLFEKYKISNPIRLIELFAGYGSQSLALKYLGVEFEHWRICEWATKSIQAYNDLHIRDYTNYSKNLTQEDIIDRLTSYGVSMNYNEPMTYDQIKRKGEKWQRETYNNIIATHNLVNVQKAKAKDLNIVDTNNYTYILTYSFPCQDLSLAGLGKGMKKGEGTRSGMLWEVERLLDECEELPQVLLMENVPQVIGTNNVKDFQAWALKLESLGYKNYVEILNSKNFGVPQNRERCFMVSVHGDYNYKMPFTMPLKYVLKDFLESNVDEKYYLSDKMIDYMKGVNANNNFNRGEVFERGLVNANFKGIAATITCAAGQRPTDNFILVPEATKKGYAKAHEGDSVNLEQPNSKTRRGRVGKEIAQTLLTGCQQGVVVKIGNYSPSGHNAAAIVDSNGIAPTVMENHGTVTATVVKEPKVNVIDIPQLVKVRKYPIDTENLKKLLRDHKNMSIQNIADILNKPKTLVEHWFRNDEGFAIPDADIWFDLKKLLGIETNKFDQSITTFEERQGVYEKSNRTYHEDGISPTITRAEADIKVVVKESNKEIVYEDFNLKIRKLTPKECWRLMGVKDGDFENVSKNQSQSSLYHLAGDSIVTTPLMAMFGELLGIDYNTKIKELVNTLTQNASNSK